MHKKQITAAGKILRRCTICKKFHAAYRVEIPEFGTCYLCYSCWKARHLEEESKSTEEAMEKMKTTDPAA